MLTVMVFVVALGAMHVLGTWALQTHALTMPSMPSMQMSSSAAGPAEATPPLPVGADDQTVAAAAGDPVDPAAPHCVEPMVDCTGPPPQPVAGHVALAAPPRSHLFPVSAVPLWPVPMTAAFAPPPPAATHLILRT